MSFTVNSPATVDGSNIVTEATAAAAAGGIPKITSPVAGNLVVQKSDGTLDKSTAKPADFALASHNHTGVYATASQGEKADTALQPSSNVVLNSVAMTAEEALTIASGVVTITKGFASIETESGAASDDLVTINTALPAGTVISIRPVSGDHTVVLKHGTGNIRTYNGNDISLADSGDRMTLILDGSGNWQVSAMPTVAETALIAGALQRTGGNMAGYIGMAGSADSDGNSDDTIETTQQCGLLTTKTLNTAAGSSYTLTVVNSYCLATRPVLVNFAGGTNTKKASIVACVPSGTGFTVVIVNNETADALDGTINISYLIP